MPALVAAVSDQNGRHLRPHHPTGRQYEATDHLIVLHKGRVLAQGTVPEVLIRAEADDVQSAFLKLIRRSDKAATDREAAE